MWNNILPCEIIFVSLRREKQIECHEDYLENNCETILYEASTSHCKPYGDMTRIENEKQHQAALYRIEELIPFCGEGVPDDDPKMIELVLLGNPVADWEDENVVIDDNALGNAIKKSLFDMSLTQKAGAELLGISPSRMSDLVHGRMEPSYRLSRALCKKLNIPPAVVLGV